MTRCTMIMTSIARPDVAETAIRSARAIAPDLPIIVGEQTDGAGTLADLCAECGVKWVGLPWDFGLSAARNALLRMVETEYFLLTEDDFLFDHALDLDYCARFLDAHPDFLCIGGEIDDYRIVEGALVPIRRRRAHHLAIDATGRGILKLPIEIVGADTIDFDADQVVVCDYIPNWGVFRTGAFVANDLWWDEAYKTGGEHLDFYMMVRDKPALRVGFWPKLKVGHPRGRSEEYSALRLRQDWVARFESKWGMRYEHEIGGPIRFFRDYYDAVAVPTPDRERVLAYQGKVETLTRSIEKWKAKCDGLAASNERLKDKLALER